MAVWRAMGARVVRGVLLASGVLVVWVAWVVRAVLVAMAARVLVTRAGRGVRVLLVALLAQAVPAV
ncbi:MULTISPECIES: hypothetical protein [Streptomyces]|uniref:Uncharacterized protein n=1 Tax=Streptomyces dengpaensis TaxID=2049881 RepID=A0ABN5I2X2_9ACTN|nr:MULTISPECIES: hypothetical protein [Streptomyces]AVH56657.1 hypothetical protein C4B68_13715 [Streptomyces dengpaensis]